MTPSQRSSYDALIIGAGQAGGPLAGALAKAGWTVALIERQHVGGTCVNEGCTPTKTMVASAKVAQQARRAAEYGIQTGEVSANMKAVVTRKQVIVDRFREGSQASLLKSGAELIEGEARFVSSSEVEVQLNGGGTRRLEAGRIFINTGGRPKVPDFPGLGSVNALNSTTIMELSEVPEHLLILGGGYIGLEFAQMFARFGSRVSVVEHGPRPASREDEDVAQALQDALEAEGVLFYLDTDAVRVSDEAGQVTLEVTTKGQAAALSGSHLLVAVGRTPNTERLNLAGSGRGHRRARLCQGRRAAAHQRGGHLRAG